MNRQRLLAKSYSSEQGTDSCGIPESIYLPNHLFDVASSNKAILEVMGNCMLQAIGLSDDWLAGTVGLAQSGNPSRIQRIHRPSGFIEFPDGISFHRNAF